MTTFGTFRFLTLDSWTGFTDSMSKEGWNLFESSSSSEDESIDNEEGIEKLDVGTSIPIWQKHFPAAFLGPITLENSQLVGGCREFVAPRDIPAGYVGA